MPVTDEHRCPNCDSPDLVSILTKTIADELRMDGEDGSGLESKTILVGFQSPTAS